MNTEQEELCLNFETGEVLRGENAIMTLEELLFLLDSAVQYNDMFPIEQSQEFVSDLRERIGAGFTKEQFEEIKKFMQTSEEE